MTDDTKLLANRYQVGDLIGRGGMAEVHIGYDTRLGRSVAIKILRPDLARDPSFQTRFRREAQAAAGLNHPAIVAVYDTGEETVLSSTGERQVVPFIVMEYVEGHTVRDILKSGAAAPIDEAVEIIAGVLEGLEYAHAAGLVHRDIKPANIMLTPTGAVKVMDFGIARAMADVGQTMTQAQSVIGTAQYLSPEQARGENVDARTDLYSTGCVLFELLCGRPPFVGDSPVSVAYQHVREEPPKPSDFAPDVPAALDQIALRALAKDRTKRYSSAQEFLSDLNAFLAGRPLSATTGQFPVGSASTGTGASAVLAARGTNPGGTKVMPSVGGPGGSPPINPLDEYVEVVDERRQRLKNILILVGAIAAAAIAIIGLFALISPKGDESTTTITVPNLVGMDQAAALASLDSYGLVGTIQSEASDTMAAGLVTRTDPPEGTRVEADSTVTVYVSVGQIQVTIPNVRGMSTDDALGTLEDAGLTVSAVTEVDGDVDIPDGFATGTDPANGTVVAPDDEVVLLVSSGKINLQNLVGKTQTAATDYLTANHLPYTIDEVQTDEKPPGTVIAQDPSPGLILFGTGIVLQVSIPVVMVTVPDVVGDPEGPAIAAIRSLGLETTTTHQYSPTVPTGNVISTNPVAGTSVAEGTTVTVQVSDGPEPSPSPSAST
jgi:beta-lactam-binding protein with PASTA domain/tRNA A-37 threonylcarbamoyl transferase component Bud32